MYYFKSQTLLVVFSVFLISHYSCEEHNKCKINIEEFEARILQEKHFSADSILKECNFDEMNTKLQDKVLFLKLLGVYYQNRLVIGKLDSLITEQKNNSANKINLLLLKSNLLSNKSNTRYSFATSLYAQYLLRKLNRKEKPYLHHLPWAIHSINLYKENFGSDASIYFLKKFNTKKLDSPEKKWMYLLYKTANNKLTLNEGLALQKLLLSNLVDNPRIKGLINTHLAYMIDDVEYGIDYLKNEAKKNSLKCNYNRIYLIDLYLYENRLAEANLELTSLLECIKEPQNSEFNTLYKFRIQKYNYLMYRSTKNPDFLIEALDNSIKIIHSFNQANSNIVNTHYADVIYMSNNILFECIYELQKTQDRLSIDEVTGYLSNSKSIYTKISNSRNILKDKVLTDQQFKEVSHIQYQIEENELKVNHYLDTLMNDMSIYEDLYFQYLRLNEILNEIKTDSIKTNKIAKNRRGKILDDDQIIEFVKTDSAYFIVNIDSENYNIDRVELNVVSSFVKNYKDFLSKQIDLNKESIKFINYLGSKIKNNTTHLFIIPDGEIYEVPIEFLENEKNITTSYLTNINKYQSNHRHINSSISLYSYSDEKTISSKEALIIPEQPVGYEEANEVADLYPNSRTIAGERFQNHNIFSNYSSSILHFSSHAYSSSSNQLDNYIYTRDKEGRPIATYGFLIKTKKLNNQLVILSACNSGTGVQKPGTGVFSLSRDFLQAGAQTVIKSLWAVNEASTKELMVEMHRNFTNGQSIGEALFNAKRTVKKIPGYEHPFYWAGFVLEGNPHVYLDLEENCEDTN